MRNPQKMKTRWYRQYMLASSQQIYYFQIKWPRKADEEVDFLLVSKGAELQRSKLINGRTSGMVGGWAGDQNCGSTSVPGQHRTQQRPLRLEIYHQGLLVVQESDCAGSVLTTATDHVTLNKVLNFLFLYKMVTMISPTSEVVMNIIWANEGSVLSTAPAIRNAQQPSLLPPLSLLLYHRTAPQECPLSGTHAMHLRLLPSCHVPPFHVPWGFTRTLTAFLPIPCPPPASTQTMRERWAVRPSRILPTPPPKVPKASFWDN